MVEWVRRNRPGEFPQLSRRTWLQLAALLIALIAAWPLLSGDGLLNTRGGGDSPFLLQRLHQLVAALQAGHFPVRWMPDANYGYGYPFFNYYAPLSIYVAALFRLAGFGYVHSLQLAQVSGFLLAAWATFNLAERWFKDEWAALVAAGAYTLAPFHMVNVYVRGDSLAEFWAMAFYPLVLLAADRVVAPQPPRSSWLLLALSYAALVLSHNISALIFTPFLLLYLLLALTLRPAARRPALPAALGALSLGLALSAWFWIPALAETSLAQTDSVTQGYFHYNGHFRGRDLVQTTWPFAYDVTEGEAFRMGLVQALLVAAGLLALLGQWRRAGRRLALPALFILGAVAVATLMITPLSRPLWDLLPLLPFTQFPWRFLSVQALAGALAGGSLLLLSGPRYKSLLALVLLLLLLVTALGALAPTYLPLSDADVSARRLAEYEWFTGNIGSTVSAEYLPATVVPRPYTSDWLERGARNRTRVVTGEATTTLLARAATRQQWQVEAGAGGATVVFPTLFWPGWEATIGTQQLATAAATGSGLIQVQVPAGAHTVNLALTRTPIRLLGEVISLLALVVLLVLARPRPSPAWGRWLLLASAPLLLLGLLARQLLGPDRSPDTLTWDFAQLGYLHHAPAGVPFDNGARLVSYSYSRETVAAGEEVAVTVQWALEDGRQPPSTALALAPPAIHRYPAAPVVVAESRPLATPATVYTLTVPADAPAGLYLPRLTVSDGRPLLATGESRGTLFLRPLQIRAAAATAGTPTIQVEPGQVTAQGKLPARGATSPPVACTAATAGKLVVPLRWSTPRPLAANYVLSLRLLDRGGAILAQCDLQPGYGFRPSSNWPAGQWVADQIALPLPERLPQNGPYLLVARLYRPGGDNLLTRRLGEVAWAEQQLQFTPTRPSFALPTERTPMEARFGDVAALRGYRLENSGDALALTLYWEALTAGERDYVRFVHLVDPDTGQIVRRADGSTVQRDGTPQHESYPTDQWTEGEIVTDPVTLSLIDIPPGEYRIATGFYSPETPANRLPVTAAEGTVLMPGYLLLEEPVSIRP